jgi:hypothetical protein
VTTPDLPTRRGVLLPPVDPQAATSLLRLGGQEGWLVPWPDGGAVVVGDVGVTVALATALGDRDTGQIVLWADPGEGTDPVTGFVVVSGGRVVTAHSWTSDGEPEVADAAVASTTLGRPDLEVGLRAFLRRRPEHPAAALSELVDLLALPADALPLLLADALPPSAVHVPAVSGRHRLGAARTAFAAVPEPTWAGPARRWQFLFPAGVAVYLAVRAALAVGTPDAPDDVWGYGTLALIGCGAAVWRARRDRRRRAPGPDA